MLLSMCLRIDLGMSVSIGLSIRLTASIRTRPIVGGVLERLVGRRRRLSAPVHDDQSFMPTTPSLHAALDLPGPAHSRRSRQAALHPVRQPMPRPSRRPSHPTRSGTARPSAIAPVITDETTTATADIAQSRAVIVAVMPHHAATWRSADGSPGAPSARPARPTRRGPLRQRREWRRSRTCIRSRRRSTPRTIP